MVVKERVLKFLGEEVENNDDLSPTQVSILRILPEKPEHPMRASELMNKVDNSENFDITGNRAYRLMQQMIPKYVEKIGSGQYTYRAKPKEEIYSNDNKKSRAFCSFYLLLSFIFMISSFYYGQGYVFVTSSIFALFSVMLLIYSL